MPSNSFHARVWVAAELSTSPQSPHNARGAHRRMITALFHFCFSALTEGYNPPSCVFEYHHTKAPLLIFSAILYLGFMMWQDS